MLQLHALGPLDLRDGAGRELRAVLQQPKRLGLLTYLAIDAPARYVRRDRLLELFWPELDQEHARAALRRALYFLRRAVGEEVLDGRGDEEVGIRTEALRCDAVEFCQALERGELVKGLDLYRGPLLAGFYIAGAPGAERWLDETRADLDQRAARAAWALAESPQADPLKAAEYARRAVSIQPDDEDSVRRLLLLLDRVGDRSGALRAFDEYARRLRLDFEVEPSADLTRIAAGLRQRREERPPDVEPLKKDLTTNLVAVLPFVVRGDPALSYLSEGLVDLLSTALEGVGALRTVDPRALLAAVHGLSAESDPTNDPELARRLRAGLWLRGSVLVSGGKMRISASLIATGGKVVGRAETQGEGEAELFELVDDLVRQLLTRRESGPVARLTRLAGLMTASLPALRAWLQGEHEFRLGRTLAALDAFQRAASADPGFALAHYRVAAAAAASAFIAPARAASALALAQRERLSERERLLVEAQHAWLHGATDDAERRYAAVVAAHPDDLEAWFLLGDLLFHSNPYRGRSIRAARAALERALALDPRHLGCLVRLARLAGLDRDWERLSLLVDRALTHSPTGDQALGLRALRACSPGHTADRAEVIERLRSAPALAIAVAFTDQALYGGDLPSVAKLGRELIAVFRSAELVAGGHLVLAHVAVAQGDLAAAEAELSRAESLDQAWGLELRAFLLALPFVPWPDGLVAAARAALEAWDPAKAPPNVSLPLAFHNSLHPHLRAYLLGLLAARVRNESALIEAGEFLAELDVPEEGQVLVERLARSLRAELLVLRGDAAGALAELAGAPADVWFQYAVASPFYCGAFERWRRGTLLLALGREEEGRGWLDSIAERSPWELPFRRAR